METTFSLTGRVLFLAEDPATIERQLTGEDLTRAQAGPLRDNVSTDEITPTTRMLVFDDRLGRVPYVGLKCGDRFPIGDDAVRNGGFEVTVGGRRYGKGSSREHSPIAEKAAGIRLIVAESFERIYRQNCHNIGLLTTSDFAIVDRLQAGEAIPIEEFLAGQDPLTQKVILAGGLLAYARAVATADATGAPAQAHDGTPRTLVEKILARHLTTFDGTPVPPGVPVAGDSIVVRADWRFSHEYFTGLCANLLRAAYGDDIPLWDRERIIAFEDHLNLAHRSAPHIRQGLLAGVGGLSRAHRAFVDRYGVLEYGRLSPADDEARPLGAEGSVGICHAVMAERHALPGEIVIGTDSHTPHSGGLGCLAFGAGSTDIAASWVTGRIRTSMPGTIRVELGGRMPEGLAAKDVVLHILALPAIRSGAAIGCVFEYGGPALRTMTTDERCTLTNMVAEMGGLTGIVEPDEETVRFLRERRGVEFVLESWMRSDPGARYADRIDVDVATLSPMVAAPGDPGNGIPLAQVVERPVLDIAYGGSCTAGKRADFDEYHRVLAWARGQGRRVAPGVKLYLQFGTRNVREYCEERGYLATFADVGAELLEPGCGSCANCGPGASTRADQVTVSAINRNFTGRSGPGNVWLASPATVAASAIAGRLVSFSELMHG